MGREDRKNDSLALEAGRIPSLTVGLAGQQKNDD